jgi:hypothetical protein
MGKYRVVVLAIATAAAAGAAMAQGQSVPVRPIQPSSQSESGAARPAAREVAITGVAADPAYGYRPQSPILIGGMEDRSFDRRVDEYFSLLRGLEGQELTVVVGEACCAYRAPGRTETLSLHVVEAGVEGQRPFRFYVNGFESGALQAPRGFLAARKAENVEIIRGALDNLRAGFTDGAVGELKPLAASGDMLAQYHLGRILADRRDFAGAYQWFLKAAEAGHGLSEATVAHMLEEGKGIAQDKNAAQAWLKRAAADGHTGSMLRLALEALSAEGAEARPGHAADLLRRASELGDPAAQAAYGLMLIQGRGVPEDSFLGLMWLYLAREAGNENAVSAWPQVSAAFTARTIARVQEMAQQWSRRSPPPPAATASSVPVSKPGD